jgi:hypothetical protein
MPIRHSRVKMALDLMIQASLDAQAKMPRNLLPVWEMLRDLCTVRVGGPRRCGHTTSMIAAASRYFLNPVLVAHNANHVRDMAKLLPPGTKVVSFVAMDSEIRGLAAADALLVDMASWMSRKEEAEMYRVIEPLAGRQFASDKTFCVVLIG